MTSVRGHNLGLVLVLGIYRSGAARSGGGSEGQLTPRNFCQGPLWSLKSSVEKQVNGPAQQDAYEI